MADTIISNEGVHFEILNFSMSILPLNARTPTFI